VKKLSKAILIGLAVLLALVVALLVGLNLYIQSPGTQARIQEELSKALRLPLKITNTSLTPWSGLRITGISIPSGDANFLEAASFSASYRFFPLLQGKLIIPEMRVESPKVIWVQNAEDKWVLPGAEKAAEISKEATQTSPEPVVPPETTETGEKKPKVDKVEKKSNFAVVIDRFDVKGGTVELFDKDHKPVGTFTGVNMTYTKLNADQVEGSATIERVVWADAPPMENVTTSFSYLNANQELWLPEVNATVAGGSVRGNYRSRSEGKHTPFSYKVEFNRINLDLLVTQSGGEAGQATGDLRGKLSMHGDTDRMEKAEGEGQLELREGRLSQFGIFRVIGDFLNIRELADFRITEGQAEFNVVGDKVLVDRVNLQAPSLEITATGTVRLDNKKSDKKDKNDKKERKIAFDARLSVDDAVVAKLPGKAPEAFTSDGKGRRMIDFNVTGTTDKPKTNLDEKLLSQTINGQLGSLLGGLFDDKKEAEMQRKKEEEKRKKEEEDRKKAEKKDKKKKDKDKDKEPDKDKDKTKEKATPSPAVEAASVTPPPPPAPPQNP